VISPWSRVLEELIVTQRVKKFPAFYGTRIFITLRDFNGGEDSCPGLAMFLITHHSPPHLEPDESNPHFHTPLL
jgi:hypothetical protein